jgi:D-xylose transport system permease protein
MTTQQTPPASDPAPPPTATEPAVDGRPDGKDIPTAVVLAPELSTSFGEYLQAWGKRIRGGESGVLPVLGGLVILVIIFQIQSSVFLSARNFSNLLVQGAPYVLLGMAEVWVLLLGEIDLSVGYVAGIGAVITAILAAPPYNYPWWASIIVAMVATGAIGAVWGILVIRLNLPSFVVTLAGLLGMEGLLLYLVNAHGTGGTIRISNTALLDLSNGNLSQSVSWIVMIVVVALFGGLTIMRDQRRRAGGLVAPPMTVSLLKVAGVAVAGVALVWVCNINRGSVFGVLRGVPYPVPIVIGVLVLFTFMLGRTRFGRYLYAIGGNAEAARRGGVSLGWNRFWAFVLTGVTSGAAGILYASRLGSVSNNIDGGTLVLYAVAAAVIGGTSLFGGRGKMVHALVGGLVIATIYNGMGLIGLAASYQFMVTALVLLAAVTVDALARRGRANA